MNRILILACCAMTPVALALGNGAPADSEIAHATLQLQKLAPELKVDKVSKIEQAGLYEVVSGRNVLYLDASMRYLFEGNLIDLEKKSNLTAARIEQLNRIDFSTLPLKDAIVSVKGNGKRKLAAFSDPDCPYCRKLEDELADVDNVTIYTFLYPIVSLHPNSLDRASNVWCAPDRAKAWSVAVKGGDTVAKRCETPIPRNIELGKKLGINGTPTLIFADGKRVPGLIPSGQIETLLGR